MYLDRVTTFHVPLTTNLYLHTTIQAHHSAVPYTAAPLYPISHCQIYFHLHQRPAAESLSHRTTSSSGNFLHTKPFCKPCHFPLALHLLISSSATTTTVPTWFHHHASLSSSWLPHTHPPQQPLNGSSNHYTPYDEQTPPLPEQAQVPLVLTPPTHAAPAPLLIWEMRLRI